MVFSGDDMERILGRTMQTKSTCRKCAASFSFEEGGSCALKNGIHEKVVVCPKCHTVYEVAVTPSGVTLLDDVTARYHGRLAPSPSEGKEVLLTCLGVLALLTLIGFGVYWFFFR